MQIKTIVLFTLLSIYSASSAWAQNSYSWTHAFGSGGDEDVKGIATDTSGNVYVAGTFTGAFSGLSYQGGGDTYIRKLGADGTVAWTYAIGGSDYDMVSNLVVDEPRSRIYVVGAFKGNSDFNPSPATTNNQNAGTRTNAYLLCLDLNGTFQWVKKIQYAGITRLAVDADGNIFYGGMFGSHGTASGNQTDVNPNGGPTGIEILTTVGYMDLFITKLDVDGGYLWSYQKGIAGKKTALIALQIRNNEIYAIGQSGSGNGWYDATQGTSARKIFFLRINRDNGSKTSEATLSGFTSPVITSLAIGSDGNAFISGMDSVGIGSNPYSLFPDLSGGSFFVRKISNTGGTLWHYSVAGQWDGNGAYDIALDSTGSVYAVGAFEGNVNFNSTIPYLQYIGNRDMYLLKISTLGVFEGVLALGASGADRVQKIHIANDTVYMAGYYSNGMNFNYLHTLEDYKTSQGGKDAFVTKLTFPEGGYMYDKRYHPADSNKDLKITMNEITTYAKAYYLGNNWTVPPYHIESDFLNRGEYLWKNGEGYTKQNDTMPDGWEVTP